MLDYCLIQTVYGLQETLFKTTVILSDNFYATVKSILANSIIVSYFILELFFLKPPKTLLILNSNNRKFILWAFL